MSSLIVLVLVVLKKLLKLCKFQKGFKTHFLGLSTNKKEIQNIENGFSFLLLVNLCFV